MILRVGHQAGSELIGIAHHGHCDSAVDQPVEPEQQRHTLARAQRRDGRSEKPDQQLAQVLHLFHDFAGGQAADSRMAAVFLRHPAPQGLGLPAERTNHRGEDVNEEAQLPGNEGGRDGAGGCQSVTEPGAPLLHHCIALRGDGATGGDQRRVCGAQSYVSGKKTTTIISMRRKSGLTLLILAAAITGAGAYFRFQGAALPGLPLPQVPGRLSQVIAAADSASAAELAAERCRLLWSKSRRACYEDFLLDLVRRDQLRLAMGALALLGSREPQIRRYGHDYSHVIGINAWTPGKDIGAVYLQCNELFQSGCYHGVIQASFAYRGTDSASVASLCRDTPGIRDNGWLRFQCVHGIGHGLVQTYTMNLPHALAGCDMLGNVWDSESCYGGAFMEFIVGGRGQSHHPHLPANAGDTMAGMDHGAMDHSAMAADTWPAFKVRERSDLLYPCSVLGERYQRACYQMQAGLVAEVTGLDFAKVAAACDTAPEQWRRACYQGIGTYVSGVTAREPRESIRLCSLGAPRYRPWCFVGLVKNFVDVTANTDDGIALCKQLGPVDIATSCYVAVGEEASVLYPSMERRRAACAKAELKYLDACGFGAGLTPQRPEGLPGG